MVTATTRSAGVIRRSTIPGGLESNPIEAGTIGAGGVPSGVEAAKMQRSIRFILTLGRALHGYGMPAYQLEDALGACARRLGLRAEIFSTPTSLFVAFGGLDDQRTHLLRVEPGDVNLEKLARLDAVLRATIQGELDPGDGEAAVERIVAAPGRYRAAVRVGSFGLTSGAAAAFFGGAWREMVVGVVIGIAIGLVAMLIARHQRSARLLELLCGLLAATLAILGARVLGPMSTYTATIAGIILLVPGLSFTVAMNELATRHLVSGGARLLGAMMVLTALGFGVAIGYQLHWLAPPYDAASGFVLPWWGEIGGLGLMAIALTVLFQARPMDSPAVLAAAAIGLYGARLGALTLGPELGAFLGALFVGMAGNLFSRLFRRPAAIMMLPGIILLVPGSIGFRSFHALLDHNVVHGVEAAFAMILVGVSIVAGLLLSNVAVPPRTV